MELADAHQSCLFPSLMLLWDWVSVRGQNQMALAKSLISEQPVAYNPIQANYNLMIPIPTRIPMKIK